MIRFEVGRGYSMTSVCDHNCKWSYTVTRRTAKSVWITDDRGETIARRISLYEGEEQVMPLGRYSMAPILRARTLEATA